MQNICILRCFLAVPLQERWSGEYGDNKHTSSCGRKWLNLEKCDFRWSKAHEIVTSIRCRAKDYLHGSSEPPEQLIRISSDAPNSWPIDGVSVQVKQTSTRFSARSWPRRCAKVIHHSCDGLPPLLTKIVIGSGQIEHTQGVRENFKV